MKDTKCKHCNAINHHYSYQCFKVIKPFKNKYNKIRRYRKQTLADRETKMQWIQANSNEAGGWNCYLHISPLCLGWLTIETLTIDHIKPKGSNRGLRHDLKNLAPCCLPCNGLKGSRTLDIV